MAGFGIASLLVGCGPRQALNPATVVGDDQTNLAIEAFLYATIDLTDNAGIPSVQFDEDGGTRTGTSAWNSIPFLIPLKEKIQFKRAASPPIVGRGPMPNPDSSAYRLAVSNYIRAGLDASQLICSNYMSGLYDRNSYFEFLQKELSVGYGVVALALNLTHANATLTNVFAGGEPLLDQGLNNYRDWRFLKINDENMRPLVLTAMQTKANYYLNLLNLQSMTFGTAINAVNEIEYLCTRAGLSYLINHGLSRSAENITFDPNTGALIFRTPTTNPDLVPSPGFLPLLVPQTLPGANRVGTGNTGGSGNTQQQKKPPPPAETDAEIATILTSFINSNPAQKANLANLLLIPPIKDLPEIKSAGPGLKIETVVDVLNGQFAAVRKRLITIERQTKVIPPRVTP